MRKVPFIAIEGPIGIGKTSLAKKLAAHFNYHLLNEIVEENPFLEKFYDHIDEWSFQTEMFFLCNRFKQLEDIEKEFLKRNKPVIADYHIAKNMIFAKRTLHGNQFTKYEQIYDILTSDIPKPNIMIYIHANLDTILKRINSRGRAFEQKIETTYLKQLSEDYENYMNALEQNHPHIPLIRIDGEEYDFIKRQDDLNIIIDHVESLLTK